jgi:ElaB/YqjD/DUF883 family membrane-anchored ribosome-binding protein
MADEAPKKTRAKAAPKAETAQASVKTRVSKAAAAAVAEVAPATESLKEQAGNFARNAGDKAKDYATTAKDKTSSALHNITGMAEDVAKTIDERVGAGYGDYVRKAANTVTSVADSLDAKSVDEIVDNTRQFVKEKPAVAIGAAVAVGFLLTRLFRAGGDDEA